MRRRLLIVYVLLLAAVLAAVAIPYAVSTSTRYTQATFIDQLNDTARFASLAEPALRSGETVMLRDEISRYDELFGIGAAVLDINGELIATSRDGLPFDDQGVRDRMAAGLAGERSGIDRVVWPWDDDPLVLVEPVGRGGEVIGVALTVAPTDQLRSDILRQWVVVAALACMAMGAASMVAVMLARWTLRPVHDLDSVAHDITAGALDARVPENEGPAELRRLAHSFNAMADTVTGTLTRQKAFVAQASHQLRTPLGVLRLRLENLADHLLPTGRREHRLSVSEVNRLAEILTGLLDLARADEIQMETREVDADVLVGQRLTAWQPIADEAGITVHRTGTARRPVIAAPEALDQALDALIDNALKFGSPGGRVVVQLDQRDDVTEVHVTDDGPGLTDEERERAVERFWRSPDHQNVPGSGLGLAIVQELIAASGGALQLRAAHPHGLDAVLQVRTATPRPGPRRPPESASADGPVQDVRVSR